jgi:hypothetical protein
MAKPFLYEETEMCEVLKKTGEMLDGFELITNGWRSTTI